MKRCAALEEIARRHAFGELYIYTDRPFLSLSLSFLFSEYDRAVLLLLSLFKDDDDDDWQRFIIFFFFLRSFLLPRDLRSARNVYRGEIGIEKNILLCPRGFLSVRENSRYITFKNKFYLHCCVCNAQLNNTLARELLMRRKVTSA